MLPPTIFVDTTDCSLATIISSSKSPICISANVVRTLTTEWLRLLYHSSELTAGAARL